MGILYYLVTPVIIYISCGFVWTSFQVYAKHRGKAAVDITNGEEFVLIWIGWIVHAVLYVITPVFNNWVESIDEWYEMVHKEEDDGTQR